MAYICRALLHHKYAAPSTPKLDAIKSAINAKLQPICFHIKNDPNYATYVYDEHFYGILCSPLFEGKSYKEINAMVDQILEPLGLKGCVRFNCQPPSRFLCRNYATTFGGDGTLINDLVFNITPTE